MKIKIYKVPYNDIQLGICFFREKHEHYNFIANYSVTEIERYVVISLFKFSIAIGFWR
jgi:hypothetical protein